MLRNDLMLRYLMESEQLRDKIGEYPLTVGEISEIINSRRLMSVSAIRSKVTMLIDSKIAKRQVGEKNDAYLTRDTKLIISIWKIQRILGYPYDKTFEKTEIKMEA